MIVQIYEVTSSEEARTLCAMGVDHIGILVGDGEFPREQSIERAHDIFAAVRPPSKGVALCLSSDIQMIIRLATALLPPILHLGASPDLLHLADVAMLKAVLTGTAIMRSIPVADDSSIALARAYDGLADFLLLDSYDPADRQVGALGVVHSWELDRRIVESVFVPVLVAGGLGPENVQEAIRASRPAGVDSKTRTDKADGSHTKDPDKVRAFVKAVRAALRFA